VSGGFTLATLRYLMKAYFTKNHDLHESWYTSVIN
jgi:hypothetical protein